MKINRLETHDRLLHFKKDQALNIAQGAEDCLKKNSFSVALQQKAPYIYIFAHPRTSDDGLTKRMLWQPRLIKPKAQTNSYLFRAQSNTDILEICWLLPPEEMWPQYKKGNVTESDWVNWSIIMYKTKREELERPFGEDLDDETAKRIYIQVAAELEEDIKMRKLYSRPKSSVEPSSS
jgi:hypothetical protein